MIDIGCALPSLTIWKPPARKISGPKWEECAKGSRSGGRGGGLTAWAFQAYPSLVTASCRSGYNH